MESMAVKKKKRWYGPNFILLRGISEIWKKENWMRWVGKCMHKRVLGYSIGVMVRTGMMRWWQTLVLFPRKKKRVPLLNMSILSGFYASVHRSPLCRWRGFHVTLMEKLRWNVVSRTEKGKTWCNWISGLTRGKWKTVVRKWITFLNYYPFLALMGSTSKFPSFGKHKLYLQIGILWLSSQTTFIQ